MANYSEFLLLAALFINLAFCFPAEEDDPSEDVKIIDGHVVDISQAPYQVSISVNGKHKCGGTIIGNDIVLSAAHCFKTPITNHKVRAGSSYASGAGQLHSVTRVLRQPSYNSGAKFNNDIALVRVSPPFKFGTTVARAPMMNANEEIREGSLVTVTGWGRTKEDGQVSSILLGVSMPVVGQRTCQKAYQKNIITNSMLCAGYMDGGRNFCKGDSGGPVMYKGRLAGIVSSSIGCARPKFPSVSAKVSALRTWIDQNMQTIREDITVWDDDDFLSKRIQNKTNTRIVV